MADALCGPSNPLQTLQKQQGVDRSLQRERLTANSPFNPQDFNFRTPSKVPAAFLDAEYEAFKHGKPISEAILPDFFLATQEQQAASQAGPSYARQPPPNWASDFQWLNLQQRHPSPLPSSQFRHAAPLQKSSSGGWHQDFLNSQHNIPQQSQGSTSQQRNHASGYRPTFGGAMPFQPQFSPMAHETQTLHEQSQQTQQGGFDEAALDEAFAKIQEELESSLRSPMVEEELPDIWDTRNREDTVPQDTLPKDDVMDREVEADELARTAGQLLDNMKDEQSEKFQQSTFMQLMRQLRDKEVKVDGDKMVPANPEGIVEDQERPQEQERLERHGKASDSKAPRRANSSSEEVEDKSTSTPPRPQAQALHPGGMHYPIGATVLQDAQNALR
ncbi:hypothetical protein MMC25_001752 [Agyrium rufum]|nr:hypothetical protein [Agyrium rufum]